VTQGVGPEFKPQYQKKPNKKKQTWKTASCVPPPRAPYSLIQSIFQQYWILNSGLHAFEIWASFMFWGLPYFL
jgi:hypothetical protein